MTLEQILGHPVLFHVLCYNGKDSQTACAGYLSTDPNVISHQLDCILAFGGPNSAVNALTYGPFVSAFVHQACMSLGIACNSKGIPFGLCFDPWTVKNSDGSMPNQATIDQKMSAVLKNTDIKNLLAMPNYLPGKPVFDFSINATKATMIAACPGIQYLWNGPDYDWIRIPVAANKTAWPCAYMQFDDGTGTDRNKSVWNQSQPARIDLNYGGSTFWNCDVSKANNSNGKNYVQWVTWNDYNEQTATEPWASLATGIRIV